jgi:hypothetical protein
MRLCLASLLCHFTVSQSVLYSLHKALLSGPVAAYANSTGTFSSNQMIRMFDPTVLDVVLFGTAVSYGLQLWQTSQTHGYHVQIDASWKRLGDIYLERREALVDLTRHMEKCPFCLDNPEEFKLDMRAAGDSINDINHAIAGMKREQRQAEDAQNDLDELVEQVG